LVVIYLYVDLQYNDLPAKDQVLLAAVVCFWWCNIKKCIVVYCKFILYTHNFNANAGAYDYVRPVHFYKGRRIISKKQELLFLFFICLKIGIFRTYSRHTKLYDTYYNTDGIYVQCSKGV